MRIRHFSRAGWASSLIVALAVAVPRVAHADPSASSAASQAIDAAIAQMKAEADNIDPPEKPTAEPTFVRPHKLLADVPASAAPVVLDRMQKPMTGNAMKDAYIRYHLIAVVLRAGPDELAKMKAPIAALAKDLPEIPELATRPNERYEPPEVGKRWFEIFRRCRRLVGIPPFERWVDPPDSFAHMTPTERRELEPLWEEAKQLKFETIRDTQANMWNNRIGFIYHYLRMYQADVLCARLASGDKAVLDEVLAIVSQNAKSNPGVAADHILYTSRAFMNGYLAGYPAQELKRFAKSLRTIVTPHGKWFEYKRRQRNLAEGAFHLIGSLEQGRIVPKLSDEGRPAAATEAPAGTITGEQLTLKIVTDAIDRAAYGLSQVRRPELHFGLESCAAAGLSMYPADMNNPGHQALAAWGLLAAGESHQDSWMQRLIDWSMMHETHETYTRAMRLQVLSMLPQKEWRDWYVRDVAGLIESVTDAGGSVGGVLNEKPTGFGDNANSQYAVMGLWAAERARQEVPLEVWRRIDNYWRQGQQATAKPGEPAGWALRSFASLEEGTETGDFATKVNGPMTAAGVMALGITERIMSRTRPTAGAQPMSKEFQAGVEWLDTHFNLDALDGDQDFYYYMWTIQNVGQATGYRTFNNIDWFREATARLLSTQEKTGLWTGPKGNVVSSSFALLYLYRANGPLAICKLRWHPAADPKRRASASSSAKLVESWNNRPHDLFNFTEYVSEIFETPTSWQIADIDQPVHELIESPLLYLTSDKPVVFDEEQLSRLREYIAAGGMLLCVPEGRGLATTVSSMKSLAGALFPDIEPRRTDAASPFYSLFQKVAPPIVMTEVHNGVRPLMLIVEKDISRDLQGPRDRGMASYNLLANIYLYASGREPDRPRLATHYLLAREGAPELSLKAARLMPAKDQPNPEPAALEQLAVLLANDHDIKMTVEDTPAEGLSDQKVAFLSATASATLEPAGAAALAKWVRAGGTLWLDALGGSPEAGDRLAAIVGQLGLKPDSLKPLEESHPILTGEGLKTGYDNRETELRVFTFAPRAKKDAQIKMASLGSGTVFVSAEDITCGLAGLHHWNIQGYAPDSARRLVANSIIGIVTKSQPATAAAAAVSSAATRPSPARKN